MANRSAVADIRHAFGSELDAGRRRAVAVRGDEKLRRHPVTALAYGGGLALIVDEFALLLDLKDAYWTKQGGP